MKRPPAPYTSPPPKHEKKKMSAPVNVPTTPMPPAQPEMGEWRWSGLQRWGFEGEQDMGDGESVADYIKRIKRNRYQRERYATKAKPVAKPVAEKAVEKVAEPLPAISFVEELDDDAEEEAEEEAKEEDDDNDSVCFRVPHEYNEKECSDNCPHKPKAKPMVYGTSKQRFTFQEALETVKQMPSDKYKKMNGVYLEAVLEKKVMDTVCAKPRTVKDMLKMIKGEFPTATKHDINRILYKNNKKLKRVATGEKTAPLWSK